VRKILNLLSSLAPRANQPIHIQAQVETQQHLSMPEGPEIFLSSRAVHAAVADQPIRLELLHTVLEPKARELRGASGVRVDARSKAVLTQFSNGVVLYSHNQLYGEWVRHKAGAVCFSARSVNAALARG
jgi:endonuclease VIII